MVDITEWLKIFSRELNNNFASRVWFVGLQGSYARGEATEASDIDIVVIFDELSALDIQKYNAMLDSLPHRKQICGFISGKNDLLNWEPSDLFQFYHDTIPIKGSLDELLLLLNTESISRAIKIGVCNIYHACIHNMLHTKSDAILNDLYKSASFVIRALYFKKTGEYFKNINDLIKIASPDDEVIICTYIEIKKGRKINFKEISEKLFVWAQKHLYDI